MFIEPADTALAGASFRQPFKNTPLLKTWFKKDEKTGDTTINKKDLTNRLAQEKGISKADAKAFVNLVFQSMTDALAKGNRVEIHGLGSFTVKKYKAYKGRNPKTNAIIKVKRKKLPFFKVGKELKERVDSK